MSIEVNVVLNKKNCFIILIVLLYEFTGQKKGDNGDGDDYVKETGKKSKYAEAYIKLSQTS